MIEWIASILLLLGSFLMLVAAIGAVRMPDIYSRAHAAAKAASLGVVLLVSAAALVHRTVLLESILIVLLVYLTAPVASHMIARSAFRTGQPFWHGTTINELAGAEKNPREPADTGSPPGRPRDR
jgi:multicomponent Na+:H+ antiporter subunit G